MRPFFSYLGGKYRAAPSYGDPLPGLPIIEPFAGGAGYATRYGAGKEVVLVEANPKIAAVWRWLIRADPDEVRGLPGNAHHLDDVDAPDPAKWLIGLWFATAGTAPRARRSPWGHNHLATNRKLSSTWCGVCRDRIADQLPLIRKWRVIEGSYEEAPDIEATWFVDPPYQRLPTAYPTRFTDYPALADWCKSRRGKVVVCEGRDADWLDFRIHGTFQAAGSHEGGRGRSVELVWSNHPPDQGTLTI